MEASGQWRFTPPTHVVAAFIEALRAHEAKVASPRAVNVTQNRDVLVWHAQNRVRNALDASWLSPIIVTFSVQRPEVRFWAFL